MPPIQLDPEGLSVRVRLTPNASRDSIDGFQFLADGSRVLAIRVRAVPEKGRANTSLIKCVARQLRLPRSSIEIARGTTSRLKTHAITAGAEDRDRLLTTLEAFPNEC